MKQLSPILFLYLITMPMTVLAQFTGDIFFDTPSVIGVRGEAVNMSISAFSGANELGAAHIDIAYDPQQLEVLDVIPSTSSEFQDNLVYRNNNGIISVVTLNDSSTTEPFGTVGLVNITFKVLDSAPSSRATLSTSIRSLLNTNSVEFSRQGFSGEIVFQKNALSIQPSSVKSSQKISDSDMIVSPDSTLGKRAGGMRPLGEQVVLETVNGPITVFVDAKK